MLLDNRRITCAVHELAHGNDIGASSFAAERVDGALRLTGRKESISTSTGPTPWSSWLRTGASAGPRSHSLLFSRRRPARPGAGARPAAVPLRGMRGLRLGGMAADGLDVPESALLGAEGTGIDTVVRAFQLTRMVFPAMSTAVLDTALRVTLHHTRRRTLYGRGAAAIPMVRTTLAEAFADLLVCEALSRAATRGLQLTPRTRAVCTHPR